MDSVIGRVAEKRILNEIYHSHEAELVAVYGRRRVGKTYLIKNYFQGKNNSDCVYFHITGIKKGSLSVQLERFAKVFSEVFYNGAEIKVPTTWIQAFDLLTKKITSQEKLKKILLFFDELPWLANRKSGILQALEYFWNRYWVDDKRLKLVVCGSSSSWMLRKIVRNRDGLHNRVTRKIRLMPFTLEESEKFLAYQGIKLSRKQLLKLYMVIGGIPYYLKNVKKNLSVDQNINQLFFSIDGLFFDEFDEIFFSLFDEADSYKELVTIVASAKEGILRKNIEDKNKLTGKGGYLTKKLNDLEVAGFITSYLPFNHKRRGAYYRIADEYCYFYLKWIAPIKSHLKRENNSEYWLSIINTPAYNVWSGYAFENVCYKHLAQIKRALRIPLSALGSSWYYLPAKNSNESGAQIDLLFDRLDNAITICEIKYTDKPFAINKQYAINLQNKVTVFRKISKTDKQLFVTMISASGLGENKYSDELIKGVVRLDDLFKEP